MMHRQPLPHHQLHHHHHQRLHHPQPSCPPLALSNPRLAHKLHQMALPLSPLVQLTTGAVHPHFPRTVLHFWLLTDAQLESLAAFYHQRDPGPWSAQYPCPVAWRSDLPLEEKRRRMGRFIGLRGCDADGPDAAAASAAAAAAAVAAAAASAAIGSVRSEDDIAEEARLAAADEDAWRRKLNPWS